MQLFVGIFVSLLTLLLYVIAFPPFNVAEAGYVFVVPYLLWLCHRPALRYRVWTAVILSGSVWFILLLWVRHLYPPWGIVVDVVVSVILGFFLCVWLLASGALLTRILDASFLRRLIVLLGLAGLWVVFEWVRQLAFHRISMDELIQYTMVAPRDHPTGSLVWTLWNFVHTHFFQFEPGMLLLATVASGAENTSSGLSKADVIGKAHFLQVLPRILLGLVHAGGRIFIYTCMSSGALTMLPRCLRLPPFNPGYPLAISGTKLMRWRT